MQRTFASAALILALGLAATAALAAPAEPRQQNGITYVNGGVGQEEQGAMRAQRADYNLQMTFATNQTGAYRSDVQVDVADLKGNTLLSVSNAGPMLFARMPPGTYRVSAAAEGKTFQRTVKLGTGARELTLHWQNDSPDDPGPQD